MLCVKQVTIKKLHSVSRSSVGKTSNSCVCVYVKVDPTGSGWVSAADAALFLKRSGLADLVLGKVSSTAVATPHCSFNTYFDGNERYMSP